MKFLVHLHSYPPHRYVGGEMMTSRLLEELVSHGHSVTVFAESIHRKYERNGVEVKDAAYLRKDIALHYDCFVTHPEIRTNVWQYVRELPYIAIVHNVKPFNLRQLDRATPTLTIANSQYTLERIPISVANGSIGARVIHPPTEMLPVSGDHDKYGIVNISLEKGGQVLNYVATHNTSLRFYAVMGGHGLQVESQPSNVEIHGQGGDMRHHYARMKCLLFPTHEETYGMVAAEALACGVPVIASTQPAIREACGDAATYIDPYDYHAWSEAVRAFESADYESMREKALERGAFLRERTAQELAEWVSMAEEACR